VNSFAQRTKNTIRHVLASAYYLSGAYRTFHKGKVLILMYHRVLSQKELNRQYVQPGMYVRVDVFEKQMQFLKNNYFILSFAELLESWKEMKLSKDQQYCVITFDDGWLDNYLHAYPILKKHKIPATIFLPTDLIGTRQWFWQDEIGYLLKRYFSNTELQREVPLKQLEANYAWISRYNQGDWIDRIDPTIEAFKNLSYEKIKHTVNTLSSALHLQVPDEPLLLDWEMVSEMSSERISFGSHSATHQILTKLPHGDLQREIDEPLRLLRQKKVSYIPVFCYPNGSYDDRLMALVRSIGYEAAVSTNSGLERTIPKNLFCLKRTNVHNDVSHTVSLFSLHLSGMAKMGLGRSKAIPHIG